MPHHSTPPSCADLETIAAIAFADIPEELRRYAADVIIRVEDFPDDDVEREMDLESSFDLLGLYRGTAMDIQAFGGAPSDVDMIFLYRRPILDYWCETGEDLSSVVKHVLIHEIGHHFGLSDDDMERIEDEA
ncbi:acetylglutamate kinase [Paramagnetospirillum kuznetsovii]|uniref:Acetylglutamate kinase n=1 Tax=Paramagnetospirillum kuznetsovii TaxID=2053833 RepID=A0A364P113_9PROT|nr:acetylglutamate kinase [Paramagnetospirillum kuznetsovii]